MKYKFGKRSLAELDTCHPDLQKIAHLAIVRTKVDFGILEGHRNKQKQDTAFHSGASKVKFPNGKHNKTPSEAFDFGIFINGKYEPNTTSYYYYVAGVLQSCASELGIQLRWGGDWDGDGNFKDQTFNDLGHIEI